MTVTEAAQLTGRPVRTLQWQAANGKIPGAVRVGRMWWIPAATAEALAAEHEEHSQ